MYRWRAFGQLYLARLREFVREPEVLFWVYGFPVLLAVGLGVAFKPSKPDPPPQPPADVLLTEPGSRYIDFLLPGLMGMNLMGSGMWGVGFVVVDMRVRKLLKRLLATPMRRSDFLLALITSRLTML